MHRLFEYDFRRRAESSKCRVAPGSDWQAEQARYGYLKSMKRRSPISNPASGDLAGIGREKTEMVFLPVSLKIQKSLPLTTSRMARQTSGVAVKFLPLQSPRVTSKDGNPHKHLILHSTITGPLSSWPCKNRRPVSCYSAGPPQPAMHLGRGWQDGSRFAARRGL